jgi:hypothetical protein
MKVIEGGFGKSEEEAPGGTLLDVCTIVLDKIGLTDQTYDDVNNITMIINAGGMFTVTSSRPEFSFILGELQKANYLACDMALSEEMGEGDE